MLEFLLLLPLIMVSILTMTFQVSVDELTNASLGSYFYYGKYDDDRYRELHKEVHDIYTRMFDDSENDVIGSGKNTTASRKRKLFPGRKCEIEAIQIMHRNCLCRKPRKRCVEIKPPRNDIVSSMPACVIVERCEGVCPSSTECLPSAVENISVPVIHLNLVVTSAGSHVTPECSNIEVERHLKCGCSCAYEEKDCNQNQVFNPSKCRCECKNSENAESCHKIGKFWDSTNCACICPFDIPQICSTGAFFHNGLCRCVPIGGPEIESRRRRPPV
ncbi:balbiani ring protein 3-like isoform X2 [Stegodyphus dumicola]|uniref:balbiani ring protein 3-like isoform X2 n=1 Tax=Stegodyphus dumicola TaxID=202533 RepID=UPI0015A88623|nr:balbiani ring protein 3-like isoform X2 [Stegodyphus dumicola]